MRSERHDLGGDLRVALRIFPRKLCGDRVEFSLRVVNRDARPKPAEDIPICLAAAVWFERFETLLRQPDTRFGTRRSIVEEPELEAWRHHAHDGVRVSIVEAHGLTDDGRVAAEAVPPRAAAKNRHATATFLVFRRQKRPAVEHRDAEHREELLAYARGFHVFRLAPGDGRVGEFNQCGFGYDAEMSERFKKHAWKALDYGRRASQTSTS